ncbi:hypothetical protein N0V88_002001 [Collariella sp. IMI 366227]|nr:hypothetical protein N0V88_002001 [Collariella sp. IMI 366227]
MFFAQKPKADISASLAAGNCVADGHHLPGHVNDALESELPAVGTGIPLTPSTPFAAVSAFSGMKPNSDVSKLKPQNMARFDVMLVFAEQLGPRDEKDVLQAFDKARRKLSLARCWLPDPVQPSALDLPLDLVTKSTRQDEVLFSSERLRLLSLDRLYTFRTALQAYARAGRSVRRENAVDELRCLFLANCRRPLAKSALLGAYRWLDPVSDDALADVCRMYQRAYGGIEKETDLINDLGPGEWFKPGQNAAKRWGMILSRNPSDALGQEVAPGWAAVTPVVDCPNSLDQQEVPASGVATPVVGPPCALVQDALDPSEIGVAIPYPRTSWSKASGESTRVATPEPGVLDEALSPKPGDLSEAPSPKPGVFDEPPSPTNSSSSTIAVLADPTDLEDNIENWYGLIHKELLEAKAVTPPQSHPRRA